MLQDKQKDVEIKSLNLKTGKKEVVLSILEAQKLFDALAELFAKKTIDTIHHYHERNHDYYPHWYCYPEKFYSTQKPIPLDNVVYCDANDAKFTYTNASQSLLCDLRTTT